MEFFVSVDVLRKKTNPFTLLKSPVLSWLCFLIDIYIMEGMIKLSDALSVMTTGDPFNFSLVTCNLKQETGGRRVSYENATLCAGGNSSKTSAKNPNHWKNHTRNIMVQGKSRPITIHTLLITGFNNQKVFI